MLFASKQFLAGLGDHLRAHRLVFRHGLWRVILIPGLLSLIYFPAVLLATGYFFSGFAEYATTNWLPEQLQTPAISFLLAMLFWSLSCFIAFITFRNAIMILYSPGLGYLSEKAEDRAAGIEEPPFTWKRAMHSMRRGILVSLVTLLLSLATLMLCYLLILIPFIGAIVSLFLIPLTQMFFAGIGFADPALDRRNYSVVSTLAYSFRNKWRLVGHGFGFILLLAVPVVGWFLAPSYGIIAGTLGAAQRHQEELRKQLEGGAAYDAISGEGRND